MSPLEGSLVLLVHLKYPDLGLFCVSQRVAHSFRTIICQVITMDFGINIGPCHLNKLHYIKY